MNQELIRKSIVSSIKTYYSRYKKSITDYYSKTWINDEGCMTFLNGADEDLIAMKNAEHSYLEEVKSLQAFDANPTSWIAERYGVVNE